MKKYKDIFIDFDDTLYDTHGNAKIALGEVFECFDLASRFDDPQAFYDTYWRHNEDLWARYARNEIGRDYLIVERFRRPLLLGRRDGEDWPSTAYCLEMSDRFLEFCAVKPGVIEGARELMAYLRSRGYRTHICSNGFREVQHRKLHASSLYTYFDTIVLSEDAGANKPLKQFFDYAFRITGAEPQTTLMIGDNYDTDIVGAMNVGIDSIHLQTAPSAKLPERAPTHTVASLCEIMQILDGA